MALNLFSIPPPPTSEDIRSPAWRDWFNRLRTAVASVNVPFTGLNFTGSNLTSILTRNHYDLQNLQGGSGSGASSELYHVTSAQNTRVGYLPAIGTANQVLTVNAGATANTYQSLSSLLDTVLGSTQGSVIYRGTSSWTVLTPGISGHVLTTQGGGANPIWNVASGGLNWQAIQTSNFTAAAGRAYPINTTGGAVTVTLPTSPILGDTVGLLDAFQKYRTNNVTLARAGNLIMSAAQDMVLQSQGLYLELTWIDTFRGWVITATGGVDNYAISGTAAPTTTDVLNGTSVLWNDTVAATDRLYVNRGGTLKSVALT